MTTSLLCFVHIIQFALSRHSLTQSLVMLNFSLPPNTSIIGVFLIYQQLGMEAVSILVKFSSCHSSALFPFSSHHHSSFIVYTTWFSLSNSLVAHSELNSVLIGHPSGGVPNTIVVVTYSKLSISLMWLGMCMCISYPLTLASNSTPYSSVSESNDWLTCM